MQGKITENLTNRYRGRLREIVQEVPILHRLSRTMRISLLQGPLNGVMLKHYQKKNRNTPIVTNDADFFPDYDPTLGAAELEEKGYATGINLRPEDVKTLVEYYEGPEYRREDPHLTSELIRKIASNEKVVATARQYLGAEPTFHCSYLEYCKPDGPDYVSAMEAGTEFHYDVADFRACALWFYLIDIDQECAAHATIAGTHRHKSIADMVTPHISNERASEVFGDRIKVFVGDAGTGFFEDQVALHRRLRCYKPRLAMLLNYVLTRTPRNAEL